MWALIIWMHVSSTDTMLILPVVPQECRQMRETWEATPYVTKAICAGTPIATITKAVKASGCVPLDTREIMLVCERSYVRF